MTGGISVNLLVDIISSLILLRVSNSNGREDNELFLPKIQEKAVYFNLTSFERKKSDPLML